MVWRRAWLSKFYFGDPGGADRMGEIGREHVRANFLATRELTDWLALMGDLSG